MMKTIIAIISLLVVTFFIPLVYASNDQPVVAIEGYDVVSYFTKGEAEKGSEKYSYIYNSAKYYFGSDQHKTLFMSNPEKYLPQYGGYCAYGVTFGKKLKASPEAWKIVDGKLYLNLNKKFLADWSKNVSESISEGNDQWELIKDMPD